MDDKVRNVLPEFNDLFNTWKLGKVNGMNPMVKKSLVDFMQALSPKHVQTLSEYFDDEMQVKYLNSQLINNTVCHKDIVECWLNVENDWQRQLSIDRKGDQIYLSFWR